MTRAIPKPSRFESAAYLKFVRQHPCLVTDCWRHWIQASHIVFDGQGRVGSKVSDTQTIALCERHHDEYHRLGRDPFAEKYGLDLAQVIIGMLTEYIRQTEKPE